MALARAALLAALALAVNGSLLSPLSKVARRLSEDGLPPSCLAACPCLSGMIQEMVQDEVADDDDDDDEYEGMGNASFDDMCKWKGELRCIKEHPDECAGANTEILDYSDRTSCVCDACPHALKASMEFYSIMDSVFANAFGVLAGDEPAGGQQAGGAMEVMCRYKSSMDCLESTPECAALKIEMAPETSSTSQRKLSSTMANWTMDNWSINSTSWPGGNWTGDNWSTWNWTGDNWSAWNWTGDNWSAWNWPLDNWSMPNGTGIDFHIDVLSILDNLTCPEPEGTTQPPAPEAEQAACPPYLGAEVSGDGSTTGSGNGPTTGSSNGPTTGAEGSNTTAYSADELVSGAIGGRSPSRLALTPLLALLAGLAK